MLNWVKRYWPALIFGALLVALFDGVISSLITCHPITTNSSGGTDTQKQQECTALAGPLLMSLTAIVGFFDAHGEAVAAVFTIVLAAFTGRLWYSTEKLWSVTNVSVQLARSEFISSHRPRMRLKHMWLMHDTAWRLGGPVEVNLDIVNIGNTDGVVTWINYESILLPINQRLPQRPPYDEMPFGPDMRITRFRTFALVQPGRTLPRPVCDGRILSDQDVHDVLWEHRRLYLIGTIEYVDAAAGVDDAERGLRQTAFCRRLSFNTYPPAVGDLGRFEIEKDPDYEFEEWGNQ
jgi:hypothetical protein